MANSKTKYEITFLNALLCLLVIFIHVSSAPISSLQKDSISYLIVMVPWRLSAFTVQCFIFLASLKIFLKKDPIADYKPYYWSRFKTILLPYIIWVVIYYIYFCSKDYFPFSLTRLLKEISLGTLVSPFYFIVVIVQFYALVPLWQKMYRSLNPYVLIILSFVIMILCGQFLPKFIYAFSGGFSFKYNDRLFTSYILYWTLGAVCGINYKKFVAFLKDKAVIITIAFLALAFSDVYFSYKVFALSQSLIYLETLHIFYCLSAILFTMLLGLHIKPKKVITAISGASYLIYLSHCFVIININELMAFYNITGIVTPYILRIIGVFPTTLLGCILYKYLKAVYFKKRMC